MLLWSACVCLYANYVSISCRLMDALKEFIRGPNKGHSCRSPHAAAGLVILPNIAVRLVEQLLIRVQLVLEEGLAQRLFDLTLVSLCALPT